MKNDGFDDLRFAGGVEASLNLTKAFAKAEECELFCVAVRKDGTFAFFADCTDLLNKDFMLQATQHCIAETQKAKQPPPAVEPNGEPETTSPEPSVSEASPQ